jgi:hypothetical protein
MGAPYSNAADIMITLRERFDANTLSVESRAITYDTSATAGAGNVGNGVCSRLTVDEFGYNLEACTVEKKTLRCRADQNSGAKEFAEEFETGRGLLIRGKPEFDRQMELSVQLGDRPLGV